MSYVDSSKVIIAFVSSFWILHTFRKYYYFNLYIHLILVLSPTQSNKDWILEGISKWQNKIDAWFSGLLFAKLARKSLIFHISSNCAWGKSEKNSKYKIYLMKCIQKGKFWKWHNFFQKIFKNENKLKTKVSKLSIFKWAIF